MKVTIKETRKRPASRQNARWHCRIMEAEETSNVVEETSVDVTVSSDLQARINLLMRNQGKGRSSRPNNALLPEVGPVLRAVKAAAMANHLRSDRDKKTGTLRCNKPSDRICSPSVRRTIQRSTDRR